MMNLKREVCISFETVVLKPKQLFQHKVEGYIIPSDLNDNPEKHIVNYLAIILGSIQKRKIKMFHDYEQALKCAL